MTSRRGLITTISERYHSASRAEREKVPDELTEVTGFHRKHAIRVLRHLGSKDATWPSRSRIYDEAVVQALTILWEAADRICGKCLKQPIPTLLEAMEWHGHVSLDPEVRTRVLKAGAAPIDRLPAPVRQVGRQGRRRSTLNTPLRKSIAMRTFSDWNDQLPGFLEMDMVAHCGKSVAGSHLHSLVVTDIPPGSRANWFLSSPALLLRLNLFIYRELTKCLNQPLETPPLPPPPEQLTLALS